MAQVVGAGGGHKRGASQRGREPNTSPNSPAFPWLPPALSSGSSPQPPSPISPHFSPSPNFPSGHLGRAEQGWGPQGAEGMWGQRVFSDLREVGERWRGAVAWETEAPGAGRDPRFFRASRWSQSTSLTPADPKCPFLPSPSLCPWKRSPVLASWVPAPPPRPACHAATAQPAAGLLRDSLEISRWLRGHRGRGGQCEVS